MKKEKLTPPLRNLIYSLILFGKIKTIEARAKKVRGAIDKLVNKIKKGTVSAKREALRVLPKKQVIEKLTNEIVPRLDLRSSGYTRIVKVGKRTGDGAQMVVVEWVTEETEEVKGQKEDKSLGRKKVGRNDKTDKAE